MHTPNRSTLRAVVLSVLLGFAGQVIAQAPLWPQWRGPTRDGVVRTPGAWPQKLTPDCLAQLWRVELGQGYSSPIVAEDRVFTVESAGGQEIARAVSRENGKPVWESRWDGSLIVPFFAWRNGNWVRCTPAYDGESLYVGGMRDVLVCLNAAEGRQRWRVDFAQRYKTPLPSFGFVSSPLVHGDHVYVQAGASVVKLNKKTGESAWRTLDDGGGMYGSAFSSPMLARLDGVEQLIVQTRTVLAGVELETGKVLWSEKIPAFRGMNIINPVIIGNRIFTSSYGGGSFLFEISRDADKWAARPLWKNKIEGNMNTPAVIDGHLYLHGRDQRFHCLELATGNEKWKSGERFGEYCSMVVREKQILALDQRGDLLLIEASPEKFILADRRRVSDEETWAHVAVCGTKIWVRDLRGLSRWLWK